MPVVLHQTPVGICRITEDEDGYICSVSIRDEQLTPTTPETEVLKEAVRQLDEYFAGTRRDFDLPLRQQGSAFQQEVWNCLSKIVFGKTISYAHQAKLMNNPLGIRAIAAANGKNQLWVIVPCHRVIGSDGNLTGYAGGLWRKKWLLEHEARICGHGQASLF